MFFSLVEEFNIIVVMMSEQLQLDCVFVVIFLLIKLNIYQVLIDDFLCVRDLEDIIESIVVMVVVVWKFRSLF